MIFISNYEKITPLFTLGSIYSAKASGAEQTNEYSPTGRRKKPAYYLQG